MQLVFFSFCLSFLFLLILQEVQTIGVPASKIISAMRLNFDTIISHDIVTCMAY